MILKKNSRNAYVNEPLKLSFYMRNPLRLNIDIEDIKVKLKPTITDVKIETETNNTTIKNFQSSLIVFTLTPTQAGFL